MLRLLTVKRLESRASLSTLVLSHQRSNHTIQIQKEKHQITSQLDKALLLVLLERSENLSGVQQVGVCVNLVGVVGENGGIEQQHNPMACEQEHNGQSCVSRSFRQHVVVEPVAQINGVDVVALQVRVHDGEKDLQKEVHQGDQNGEDEGVRVGCHCVVVGVMVSCCWGAENVCVCFSGSAV